MPKDRIENYRRVENNMVVNEQHIKVVCQFCRGEGIITDSYSNEKRCEHCDGIGEWTEDE